MLILRKIILFINAFCFGYNTYYIIPHQDKLTEDQIVLTGNFVKVEKYEYKILKNRIIFYQIKNPSKLWNKYKVYSVWKVF